MGIFIGWDTVGAKIRDYFDDDPDMPSGLGKRISEEEYFRNRPQIMEILTLARPICPEFFHDMEESEFKLLFDLLIHR